MYSLPSVGLTVPCENQLRIKANKSVTAIVNPYHTAPAATAIQYGRSTESMTYDDGPRNVLGGGWDRIKSFDRKGGVLKKSGSGVELIVPKDAVFEAHIYGKVFTDMIRFYTLFQLKKEKERFISPVVEFIEYNQIQFERHMEVKIPCVHDSSSDQGFRVLCLSGYGRVDSVPLAVADIPDEDKPDVYYEVRPGAVHVFTKHFTTFSCVECHTSVVRLEVFLLGSKRTVPDGRKPEIRLSLYVCDRLYSLQDFRTSLAETVEQSGLNLWRCNQIFLQREDRCNRISASLGINGAHWALATRADGTVLFENNPQSLCFINSWACETVIGQWLATCSHNNKDFECIIDIQTVDNNGANVKRLTTLHVWEDC